MVLPSFRTKLVRPKTDKEIEMLKKITQTRLVVSEGCYAAVRLVERVRSRILLCSLFVCCFALSAIAQGPDQCRDALQKTDVNRVDTVDEKLAYLWTIQTNGEWTDATKDGGALKAIFNMVPVEATANFDSFKNWRQSLSEKVNWTLNLDQSHRLLTSFIPEEATGAWLKCMQIDKGGIEISAFDIQPDIVRVVVSWVQPPNGDKPIQYKMPMPNVNPTVTPINGWQGLPETVNTSRNWQLFFRRSKTADLRVAMSVGAWKPSLIVPKTPVYVHSCTKPFMFKGVHSGPTGWSVSCARFEPGTKVTVAVADALLKVEEPGAISVAVRASLAGGQVIIPQQLLVNIPFWGIAPTPDDNPKPWSVSNIVTVPWDGVVDATIFVDSAEVLPGRQSSLSATQGSFVVVKLAP